MSSAVAELDGYLQQMLALKPPGVSGSKISSITSLCTANVQSESVLVQKIYTHFKRTPGTHKLGVLYVVDSVTRQWVEAARKSGQQIGPNAPDGTYAAGVNRVTELLPSLMSDIISTAPEDQKEKIKKLVDIWERSYTFPGPMLVGFKEKLNAPPQAQQNASTTPEGSPGPGYVNPLNPNQQHQQQPGAAKSATPAPAPDTSSILKALADMAKKNTGQPGAATASPAPPTGPAVQSPSVPAAIPTAPAAAAAPNPLASLLQAASGPSSQAPRASATPVNVPNLLNNAGAAPGAAPFSAANLPTGFSGLHLSNGLNAQATPSAQPAAPVANPLAALLGQAQHPSAAPNAATPAPITPAVPGAAPALSDPMQQLNMLPLLMAQGIPQEQWAPALQALTLLASAQNTGLGGLNPAALTAAMAAFGGAQPQQGGAPGVGAPPTGPSGAGWGGQAASHDPRDRHDRHHDRDRDFGHTRSPPYRRRSRSPWDRRRELSPPRRRESPVYGEYRTESPGRRGAGGMRGGRGYRERSPGRGRRRSPSPQRNPDNLPPPGPKLIEIDLSLPNGCIKVLSRTLFVGGVTIPESHMRQLFSRYGIVQTCIVNLDKRHAFVKMINRTDAVQAREGMENFKSGDMQLRTRWGVGFGPRDCSDYQTGVSIIPIDRLTDADRKWMLTAEYGGTGGKPIQTGMVVEEPDIEIGAGVSSKAISRRMATDTGGKRGPVSSRGAERFRRDRGSDFSGNYEGPNSFANPNAGAWGGHNAADPHGHHGNAGNFNDPRAGQSYADRGANDSPSGNAGAIGVPPAVPGFGYSFPGMPNMFPGFMMGGNGNGGSGTPGQGDGQGHNGNGQ